MGDVVLWRGQTKLDIPAERVLANAVEEGLDKVVILGYTAEGEEFFASSIASAGLMLWLMERLKQRLLEDGDT